MKLIADNPFMWAGIVLLIVGALCIFTAKYALMQEAEGYAAGMVIAAVMVTMFGMAALAAGAL